MTKNERETPGPEKLVKKTDDLSFDLSLSDLRAPRPTNRKKTPGYIRRHRVKGRTYYTYCRGYEREIYLGSAETILEVVQEGKPMGKRKP